MPRPRDIDRPHICQFVMPTQLDREFRAAGFFHRGPPRSFIRPDAYFLKNFCKVLDIKVFNVYDLNRNPSELISGRA